MAQDQGANVCLLKRRFVRKTHGSLEEVLRRKYHTVGSSNTPVNTRTNRSIRDWVRNGSRVKDVSVVSSAQTLFLSGKLKVSHSFVSVQVNGYCIFTVLL